jgi:hypothetical protein
MSHIAESSSLLSINCCHLLDQLIGLKECVNENETPPLIIQRIAESLLLGNGLLIQTASGNTIGLEAFPTLFGNLFNLSAMDIFRCEKTNT